MKKTILAAVLLAGTALATLPAQADTFAFGGGTNPLLDTVFTSNNDTSHLTVAGPIPAGNQPQNIVCIICGTNQPQQDTTGAGPFAYNNYQQGGNISTFLASSTSTFAANGKGAELVNNTLGTGYDGSFLRAYLLASGDLNGVLNVGIDVNTATGKGPEILERFAIVATINGIPTLLADTGAITQSLPTLNNGTGFPDYTISGFNIDRADILASTQILFLARWSNSSDGAESFFLVPQIAAVPGPIVGAGIPGIVAACGGLFGLNFWRRRRNGATIPA
jgi:hypothetical protein